jgi:uncharacterized protein involved in type VI secretion and phage assembly
VSLLEDIVGAVEESIEGINRKYYGVVTGKVTSLQDPLSLGRVQIQLPFIDASDTAPWARIATPFAGNQHGHYFLPAVDSEVLVVFEHGDAKVPYIIGGLWNAMSPPPRMSPEPTIHVIRTKAGNQIVIEEDPETITVQNGKTPPLQLPAETSTKGPHNTLKLGKDGVDIASPKKLEVGVQTTKLKVEPSKIELSVGSSKITMTSSSIELQATQVTIKASGSLTIQGATVSIN